MFGRNGIHVTIAIPLIFNSYYSYIAWHLDAYTKLETVQHAHIHSFVHSFIPSFMQGCLWKNASILMEQLHLLPHSSQFTAHTHTKFLYIIAWHLDSRLAINMLACTRLQHAFTHSLTHPSK